MGIRPKKLFTLALVILLIAILSIGTLAWFSATESVTNTFYIGAAPGVGGDDPDEKPPFGFNVFGQRQDTEHDPEYYEFINTYNNVLPASVLDKKVYFHNTGVYDQWVRLHLIFSDGAAWKNAIQKGAAYAHVDEVTFITEHLLGGLNENLLLEDPFVSYDLFGTTDTLTLTFYYKDMITTDAHFLIMDTLTIPGILNNEDMAAFGPNGFTIQFRGDALQANDLPADNAIDAFKTANWKTGDEFSS